MRTVDNFTLGLLLVGLIVIACGLLITFLPEVKNLYNPVKQYNHDKPCLNEEVRCVTYYANGKNFTFNDGSNGIVNYVIQFRTFDEFTVDNQINYSAIVTILYPRHSVDKFYFLILQPNEETEKINKNNISEYLHWYNKTHSLITLDTDSVNVFYNENNFNSTVEEYISLMGIMYMNNEPIILEPEKSILRIGSHLEKLQAQTNRALLKNIDESDVTNDRILGLTVVGIGIVPLAFGLEMIIDHRKKKDDFSSDAYSKPSTDHKKWNMPFYD